MGNKEAATLYRDYAYGLDISQKLDAVSSHVTLYHLEKVALHYRESALYAKASTTRSMLRAGRGPCNKYIKDVKCRLVVCAFALTNSSSFKTVLCPNPENHEAKHCTYVHEGETRRQAPPKRSEKLFQTRICEKIIRGVECWGEKTGSCGHAHKASELRLPLFC